MKTKMLLMVGNPGEDDHTVRDTIRMIETVHPDFSSVSEARVFPGTELYELAKQKGLVTDAYWLTDRPAPYFTIENNLEKLLEWSNIIMSANAGISRETPAEASKHTGTKHWIAGYRRGDRVQEKRVGEKAGNMDLNKCIGGEILRREVKTPVPLWKLFAVLFPQKNLFFLDSGALPIKGISRYSFSVFSPS